MCGHILKKASIWDRWPFEGDAQGLIAAMEFAGVNRELYRIPQFIAPIETAIQKILFQIAIDNQITGFAILLFYRFSKSSRPCAAKGGNLSGVIAMCWRRNYSPGCCQAGVPGTPLLRRSLPCAA